MIDRTFPDGFVWGASTSAHQIEGDNIGSDWWAWEQAGGAIEPSGAACDSWHRWCDDLDIAGELGLDVVRISVEWARVEPEPGYYDESVLVHYAGVLAEARARGLRTMVVLWHFTNPQWLAARGDWVWRDAPDRFARYATVVARHLGELVDYWATVNEVNTYAWRGYILGVWPPGRRSSWLDAAKVMRNLATGHKRARAAIREVLGESTQVGLTHVLAWTHPAEKGGALSLGQRIWWQFLANDLFLDMVASQMDWLGVQYYHDSPTRAFGIADDDGAVPRTDMGWRIVPEGIYQVTMRAWKRYRLPMMITENGLADAEDRQRGRFIVDHLAWLHEAIEEGADVRGYLHWSLIDNFEWAHGFGPRFGLAAVDYTTFERTIRPSARLYADIVRRNGLASEVGQGLVYADGTGSLAPDERAAGSKEG